jgi:hypothetical protein
MGDVDFRAVLAAAGAQRADDLLGVGVEVLVHVHDPLGVAAQGEAALPRRPAGGRQVGVGIGVAAAEHEQVGDHAGAGGLFVGAAGESDGGDQLG